MLCGEQAGITHLITGTAVTTQSITRPCELTVMDPGTTRTQEGTALREGSMDHTEVSGLAHAITLAPVPILAAHSHMDHTARVVLRKLITRARERTRKRDKVRVCTAVGDLQQYNVEMIGLTPNDSPTAPAIPRALHEETRER